MSNIQFYETRPRQMVILSGKGGTGKTSVTASFIHLASPGAVLVDADVDASNLELLLEPTPIEAHDYIAAGRLPSLTRTCARPAEPVKTSAVLMPSIR